MKKFIQYSAVALMLFPTLGVANDLNAGIAAYESGDYASALEELRPLAEQGNAEAQYTLGFMYNRGRGVRSNGVEALEWWHRAAEQNHAGALYKIGDVYHNSMNDAFWGIERSREEASEWYILAAGEGSIEAMIQLSNMAPFTSEGVKWNRLAAEEGDAEAQHKLGRRYQHGWGVPTDRVEAIKWFRLAAAQEYTEALFALGAQYEFGSGVDQDNTTAYMWYTIGEATSDMTSSNKSDLEEVMSEEAKAEAEERASVCMSSNYQQGCEEAADEEHVSTQ
ncbi:tetratricopeptide repeat protein [Halomonas dongshanensis]|uniref:Sel1 repeat family protein n=1 Tax=Halomonas dongshanensis TaxID=2890835 RepID=A0ABT2EHF4_9GAMM|nr:tetratricopeptide repeat protein [Halomonas dongshanensis]MCS2611057.1 sel1 repeat family protein [Halomonas dongshanensis]